MTINVKRTEKMKRKSDSELKAMIDAVAKKQGSLSSAAAEYEWMRRRSA